MAYALSRKIKASGSGEYQMTSLLKGSEPSGPSGVGTETKTWLGLKIKKELLFDAFGYILTISYLILFRLAENHHPHQEKLGGLMVEVGLWATIFLRYPAFSKLCTWLCCIIEYLSLIAFYGVGFFTTTIVFVVTCAFAYWVFHVVPRYQDFEIWPRFGRRTDLKK